MADAIACLVHLIKESEKQQNEKNAQSYFKFRFFKVKKTSLVTAVLGILVFILTLFSMKQQNDYSLLINEYYRQRIEAREIQEKTDSLRIENPDIKKK